MNKRKSAHEVIPSARRMVRSLRDMGYDFTQAVADVVDNSIEAGATRIEIDVEFEGEDSWVRIVDNGRGMGAAEVLEAMRYGSERDYGEDDLGKFGLGLKTASLSQCQRLTVASRRSKNRRRIAAFAWDLDHIYDTNLWEVLRLPSRELRPLLKTPLKNSTGTIVLWERLDRILGYKYPHGEFARKKLSQMCRDLEFHLGMVFHRFLSGDVPRRRRLQLSINKNDVRAWDPFCRQEHETKVLQSTVVPIEHNGVNGKVLFQPYILPRQDRFSSQEAFQAASGPSNWNLQQGFYIYRANRMIQSGGWSNLRGPDEHTKLARIAVSFLPDLDEAFKINVAKMRVQMPMQIRDVVKESIVGPVSSLARSFYDKRDGSKRRRRGRGADGSASTKSEKRAGRPTYDPRGSDAADLSETSANQVDALSFREWTAIVMAAARGREKRIIEQVVRRIVKEVD